MKLTIDLPNHDIPLSSVVYAISKIHGKYCLGSGDLFPMGNGSILDSSEKSVGFWLLEDDPLPAGPPP